MRELTVNVNDVSDYIRNSDLSRVREYTIADNLGVSRNTLMRRMKMEGLSFSRSVQAERQRRVFEALRENPNIGGMRLAEISGFSSPGCFYSAFKRWVGVSFINYQKRAK